VTGRVPGDVIAPWVLRAVQDLMDAGESDATVAERIGVREHAVQEARAVLTSENDEGDAA